MHLFKVGSLGSNGPSRNSRSLSNLKQLLRNRCHPFPDSTPTSLLSWQLLPMPGQLLLLPVNPSHLLALQAFSHHLAAFLHLALLPLALHQGLARCHLS